MNTILSSLLLNAALATLLAGLVWAAGAVPMIGRRPGLRHLLWLLVMLKLVTPPMLEWSILPHRLVEQPTAASPQSAPLQPLEITHWQIIAAAPAATPATEQTVDEHWTGVVLLVAACGTLLVVLLALRQTWKLHRVLRRAVCDDERLKKIARRCARRMGLSAIPEMCIVSARLAPLLWVRPRGPLIVLPKTLADQLNDEQLVCITCHEIAHYVRRDHWTNLLSLLVAAVCWWNPLAWWIRRQLRITQEACCDALVLSSSVTTRRTYAETLFQALEFMQTERAVLPALASGFGGKSSTRRRFEMISHPGVNHRLAWWHYPIVLAGLVCLPLLPTSSDAQQTVEQQPTNTATDMREGLSASQAIELGLSEENFDITYLAADEAAMESKNVRSYTAQRSPRGGLVILAFDKASKRLLWSYEIDLPAKKEAVGQRYMLHASDNVVTIAVAGEDGKLQLQELNAATGEVVQKWRVDELLAAQRQNNNTVHVPDGGKVLLAGEAMVPAVNYHVLGVTGLNKMYTFGEEGHGYGYVDFDEEATAGEEGAANSHEPVALELTIRSEAIPPTEQLNSIWQTLYGKSLIDHIQISRDGGNIKVIMKGRRATGESMSNTGFLLKSLQNGSIRWKGQGMEGSIGIER